jgi:hypothetical protein
MSPLIEPALLFMTLSSAAGGSLSMTTKAAGQRKGIVAYLADGDAARVEQSPNWHSFLMSLASPHGRLSPVRARQVQDLWDEIARLAVRTPYAAVTEDGGVSMTWDRGRHHFEIEVLPDGNYDWFYMDRESNARSGEEGVRLGIYSPELVSRLRITAEGTWRS